MLQLSKPYKQLFSLLLLLLYVFIATPVQLWHHHHSTEKSVVSFKGSDPSHHYPVDSISEDCKICSHHYSSCLPALAYHLAPDTNIFPVLISTSLTDLPEQPFFEFSNKGPPYFLQHADIGTAWHPCIATA